MDIGSLAAILIPLGIVIYWFVTFAKNLTNRNWNGAITQLIAFFAAFGAIVLYAHSSHIDLGSGPQQAIAILGWQEQALLALFVASTAGTGSDVLRTFNRADGNVAETLIPGQHQ
jgi:hypothetical protein